MTVNAEYPYVNYTANGVTDQFTFTWSSGDPTEIYEVNRVLRADGDAVAGIGAAPAQKGRIQHLASL